jgi:hypothetical protein
MVYIHTRIIIRVKRPDKILRENYSVKNCVVSVKKKKVIPTERIKRSKSLLIFNHYENIDCILGRKLNRKTQSLTTGLVENIPLDPFDEQTLNEEQKFPTEIRILPKTKNRLRKIIRLLILISFCFVFNSLQFVITFLYAKLGGGHVSIFAIIISQIFYLSNSALNCFLYALYSKKFYQSAKEKFPFLPKIIAKFKVFLVFYLLAFISCVFLGVIFTSFLDFCV